VHDCEKVCRAQVIVASVQPNTDAQAEEQPLEQVPSAGQIRAEVPGQANCAQLANGANNKSKTPRFLAEMDGRFMTRTLKK
jgi:hypothetical protein